MIKLNNYKIIKKIASGGMGDVYLAEHTVLENKVVIKSLHSNLVGDEGFRKRFRTEAKTQFKLSHPNIVKLIDFQEQEDGLFLIMEYIEGKQLNDYITQDTGPIPEDKLTPLFLQMLSAMKYAHSKGLVHRDIKPANIMITPDGNVKVIDFGIAKDSDEDKGLTKTGVQVGTVSYMSPEQVNAEKVDKRTDIYSLGVTLFQMAVGKAPFAGQTNTFKIQVSIVNDSFPKAKDHYPSVSDKLEVIIEKATQKNKKDRYQTCDEFIKSFDAPIQKTEKLKPIKNVVETTKNIKTETKETIPGNKGDVKEKRNYTLPIFFGVAVVIIALSLFQLNENNILAEKERIAAEKERIAMVEKKERLRIKQIKIDTQIEEKRLDDLEKERARKQEEEKRKAEILAAATNVKPKYGCVSGNCENGKGKYTWKSGDVYEGDFIKGDKSGKGKYTWKNGEVYEGDFIEGARTGKGKYTWKSGNVYEGDWIEGARSGKGKYTFKSGGVFDGLFANNKKHGKGTYTFKDGNWEIANYINGLKNGPATFYYDSGRKSEKTFHKDGKCTKGCD